MFVAKLFFFFNNYLFCSIVKKVQVSMFSKIVSLKVLVSGDVQGKFNEFFSRVSSVNKKNGPFEMILCTGSFFGENNEEWEKYVKAEAKVPVTTYILGPSKPEHQYLFPNSDGCEMCPNVIYLGKKGILTCSSGLQVVYLSGVEGSNKEHNFNAKDVESLQIPFLEGLNIRGVDILLTSQWPRGVTKFAGLPKGIELEKVGSDMVAKLACTVRPRYHFSSLEGGYYERLPYRNHQVLAEAACHTTRFISLAPVGNSQKQKWLYAFSITPLTSMSSSELSKQPQDVTECPYKFTQAELQASVKDSSQQYFYDLNTQQEKHNRKRTNEEKDRKGKKHPRSGSQYGPCWFCLASPEVEKHLVVSVGEEIYLALAKGGLTSDHILILPVGHHQSTVELPDSCLKEMKKYQNSLCKYFSSRGKTVVFFERNYKTSHLQIQVVPLPAVFKTKIKEVFLDYALSKSIELDEIPKHSDLKQVVQPGSPYFYVELDGGEKLFHRIKKAFPLQFGREVLASELLLNMPHRTEWKECQSNKEEEVKAASEFRNDFKCFDFTFN